MFLDGLFWMQNLSSATHVAAAILEIQTFFSQPADSCWSQVLCCLCLEEQKIEVTSCWTLKYVFQRRGLGLMVFATGIAGGLRLSCTILQISILQVEHFTALNFSW